MSIQTLVEKIKEKGNPTIAGLDARLEYIPQHISGRNMITIVFARFNCHTDSTIRLERTF